MYDYRNAQISEIILKVYLNDHNAFFVFCYSYLFKKMNIYHWVIFNLSILFYPLISQDPKETHLLHLIFKGNMVSHCFNNLHKPVYKILCGQGTQVTQYLRFWGSDNKVNSKNIPTPRLKTLLFITPVHLIIYVFISQLCGSSMMRKIKVKSFS